jgi:hypothetical protein
MATSHFKWPHLGQMATKMRRQVTRALVVGDLRGFRGDTSVVVETKGVTKSAAESHCAQLKKWVAEDLEAGRKSKGILIINAFLNDPPLARTQPTFPDQMRRYAEMRNHCLASGLQLLNLARTTLAEPKRADELANLLLTQLASSRVGTTRRQYSARRRHYHPLGGRGSAIAEARRHRATLRTADS